jgi:hypothetical protein
MWELSLYGMTPRFLATPSVNPVTASSALQFTATAADDQNTSPNSSLLVSSGGQAYNEIASVHSLSEHRSCFAFKNPNQARALQPADLLPEELSS